MSETTLTVRIIAEDEASDVFNQVSQAAKQMSTEVSSAGSAMGGAARDIQNVGSAAKSAATESKSFGTSMASLGFGIASTASSVIGLVRSFENVSRAQDKATAANTKLESANVRVEKAQNALNQAIAKFGPESQQAAQAAAKVELELRKQGDAAARAANAAENVGFAWSNAAIDGVQFGAGIGTIVSSLGSFKNAASGIVGTLGGLAGAFKNGGGSAGGLATAISTLSPAFAGFTTQATGIKGALSGIVTAFSGGATGAAGFAAAFGPIGLAIGAFISVLALAQHALEVMPQNFTAVEERFRSTGKALAEIEGPANIFIQALNGIDQWMRKMHPGSEQISTDMFKTKDALKAAGQAGEEASQGFGTLGEAVTGFAKDSKAASIEAPKLFDEIIAGANKAGIAIESISGADIKNIFGSMAEGAAPAAESVDLVAKAFDAYSKAATDGKAATDPLTAAQSVLAGQTEQVGKAARQTTSSMSELQAQYFSTLRQIKEGAAIGPGGVIGSKEALQRMGIPDAQILQGAAAEAALGAQKGFDQHPATLTTKTDNTKLNTGVDQAKTKAAEVPNDHVTFLNADTGQFEFPVEQSKQQLVDFPTEKKTNLAADASIFSTVVSGAGGTLEANIPDTKKTGLQAIADAFTGIVTGAGSLLETNVPDLKGVKLGADKSLFSTVVTGAGSELDAKVPLNRGTVLTALAGAFTGVVNTAGATLGLKIPERKDTALGANDSVFSSVVQGAGQSLQIKIPERKSTALDANKSLFEQGINAAASALGIKIPNSKETQLKAKDDSTPTINIVKSSLDTLRDKTITITVNAKAGIGASGYGKASLGLRHGGTAIANGPMNIRVGEGFHPELVSVMPLSSGFSYHAAGGGTFASSLGDNIFNVAKPQIDRIIAAETARLQAEGGTSYSEKAAAAERQREKESREAAGASSFRRGGTDVVTKPTNLQVGEGFKPEVVSVTPLTGPHAPPALRMDTTAITQGQKLKEEASKKERKREIENMAFRRTTSAVAPLHAAGGGTFAFGLDKLFAGTTPKGGTATATAAVSMQLEDKDTFQQDTQELGKAFGTTIPKEWNTEVTADTSGANASVTAYGRSINSIPKEKETEIDADDRGATQAISSVKRALDTLPANKNIKITITSPAGASGTLSFRHGGTSIISHPTNIRVGEGFNPELVSVVPLGKVPHAAEGGEFLSLGPLPQEEPPTPEARMGASDTKAATSQAGLQDAFEAVDRLARMPNPNEGRARYKQMPGGGQELLNPEVRDSSFVWEIKHGKQVISAGDAVLAQYPPTIEDTKGQKETHEGAVVEYQDATMSFTDVAQQAQEAAEISGDSAEQSAEAAKDVAEGLGEIALTLQETTISYGDFRAWLRDYKAQLEVTKDNAAAIGIYAAKGFGPSIVRDPTMFLAGEAGPEMVEVTPLRNGTRARAGGGGGANWTRIEALLEKLVRKGGGGMEASLIVDGQRMASVAEKYIGTKSYGAR